MTPQPAWRHEIRSRDGHITVALSGEIDMSGAAALHHVLDDAVHNAEVVTVDFAGVGFIDSTVISALISAGNTARNAAREFTVVNPGAQVRRVLEITGVLDTLAGPHIAQA